MKEEIAKILKIPVSTDWDIFDSYESLYLIHYSKNSDLRKYGYLKGYIVDVETKKVIPSGAGYSYKIISDSIQLKDNKVIVSETRKEFQFDLKTVKITFGVEGKWFCVFKYKGKTMYSSSKKINDPELAHLNLDVDETDCDYYIMMDKSTMVASKYNPRETDAGYTLFYLRTVGADSKIIQKEYPSDSPYSTTKGPTVVSMSEINISEANDYLRYGGFNEFDDSKMDIRLKLGEFIYIFDGNNLIEVLSSSYGWRKSISYAGSSTDNYYNFICNITLSYIKTHTKDGLETYLKLLPIFKPVDLEEIRKEPLIIWTDENNPAHVENRQKNTENIFYAYLASIPLFRQVESVYLLNKFNNDKDKLYKSIKKIFDDNLTTIPKPAGSGPDFVSGPIPKRARDIIKISIDWSVETFDKPDNTRPLTHIIYNNLKIIIRKEDPKSIYKLFKDFGVI